MSAAGNPNDELVAKLWSRRHELTKAEWLEAAPILLGTAVALQRSNAEKDEALAEIKTLAPTGLGWRLDKIHHISSKALSHSSESGK